MSCNKQMKVTLLDYKNMKHGYEYNIKVKVKLYLCFNWALRHEGVWRSGGV